MGNWAENGSKNSLCQENVAVKKKLEPEEGQLLGRALPFLFSFFLPLAGDGLLLRGVVAAATVDSWPPQASHKASAALTIATAVLWFLVTTASRMEGRS